MEMELVGMQVVGQETDAVVPGCPSHGDRLLPGIVVEGVSRLRGGDSGDPPHSRDPGLPRSGLTTQASPPRAYNPAELLTIESLLSNPGCLG